MPADLDIGQVLIIAIAMIAAFVQWVWKLIQESKAARERARPQRQDPADLEEYLEPPQRPSIPPPLPAPRGGGVWDLVETFKEELRRAQEASEPRETPAPPPLRPDRRRVAIPPPPIPLQKSAPMVPVMPPPPFVPSVAAKVTSKSDSGGIRVNLMNLDALKQAIILKEILGPPKALQSPSDSF